MPAQVRVVPVDLQVSAFAVDGYADSMKAQHAAADGRVEGAQRGLPLGAAAALRAATTSWQAESARLFARMVEHSAALRTSAAEYVRTDQDNGAAVDGAASTIRPA